MTINSSVYLQILMLGLGSRKKPSASEPEPFVTVWRTTTSNETITLPFRSGYNYDCIVDWGDGQQNTITVWNQAERTHTYATAGDHTVSISGICESFYFNLGGDRLKIRQIVKFGDIEWVAINNAFRGCTNLTVSTEAGPGNFSKVTNSLGMNFMFADCSSLTTVPALATYSVTSAAYMFYRCSSLTEVSLIDTSNVLNMSNMFQGCNSLASVALLNTSKVTNMEYMFSGCSSLSTIPQFDMSSVTSTSDMFSSCYSLTSVPALNTLNVSSMSFMFSLCSNLISVGPLQSQSVGGFVSTTALFSDYCLSLESAVMVGLRESISYRNCKLSRSAIVDIFTGLGTVTSKNINIQNNPGVATLTQTDRNIALNKGWTITS